VPHVVVEVYAVDEGRLVNLLEGVANDLDLSSVADIKLLYPALVVDREFGFLIYARDRCIGYICCEQSAARQGMQHESREVRGEI
jgi:hypothetical protein